MLFNTVNEEVGEGEIVMYLGIGSEKYIWRGQECHLVLLPSGKLAGFTLGSMMADNPRRYYKKVR